MVTESSSLEYETLIRSTDKLVAAFKTSLISISNQLLSKGFVSPEEHDRVTGMTTGLSDDMKATSLVKCVRDQVSTCPGRYYDFMALPLFEAQWLRSLHGAVTAEYGKFVYS